VRHFIITPNQNEHQKLSRHLSPMPMRGFWGIAEGLGRSKPDRRHVLIAHQQIIQPNG
jgi:hypothetical protein